MIPYFAEPSIELAGRTVHGWGLMVSFGIALGFAIAWRRAKDIGVQPRHVLQLGVAVVGTGFVFAHLVHVLAYDPGIFRERASMGPPIDWWKLLRTPAGYSSFGGFLGAAVAAALYGKLAGIRLRDYVDPVLYGFVPGWMCGRIGCFLAHDHRGVKSDFPLAVEFPTGAAHDLGLYEAMLAASLWAMTVVLDRRGLRHWTPGLVIAIYAVARFGFEELRRFDARYLGLTPAQFGALPLFALGLTLVFLAHRRAKACA